MIGEAGLGIVFEFPRLRAQRARMIGVANGRQPIVAASSKISMPPNSATLERPCTFRIVSPSRIQAPPAPAKLMLEYLANALRSSASCANGCARNSPMSSATPISRPALISADVVSRSFDMPEARMTVSSWLRASMPMPSSAPTSAPAGNDSSANCGTDMAA